MKLQLPDPVAERIAQYEKWAVSMFVNHRVTCKLDQGLFRHWVCRNPDSCNGAFYVTTEPGSIFVTGDLGDIIISRNDDMIAWARGSINSIGYFASKVPKSIPTKEFDGRLAKNWYLETLLDRDGYSIETRRDLRDLMEDGDFEDEAFVFSVIATTTAADDGEYPDLMNYNSNFLWCRECLKYLLANIPEPSVC